MGKLLVILTAIIFALYGVGFACAPALMAEMVTGGIPATSSALIDTRSTYGGLSIAIGVILWKLAQSPALLPHGIRAVAVIMGAMALTRTLGIAVDGSPNPVMWAFLAAEVTAFSLATWQIRLDSQR